MKKVDAAILIKVSADMKAQLEELANRDMVTVSHLIRQLIMEYLRKQNL